MSASIHIKSGIAAGTNYWIDRPVLRIGSDPQCEICLPTADLAPHALTLEFRGGVYRAYNRGTSPVYVGSAAVQPGAAVNWEDGDTVTLPGDVRLVMAFDGDPRPCPRRESPTDDGFNDRPKMLAEDITAASPEEAKKAKSKSRMQMAVIAACVLAMGGFLLMNQMGGGAPPAPRGPSFDAIVVSSLDKDEKIRTYVQKMQLAQSFIVRGHADYAKLLFAQLRDQLMRQMDALPAADQEFAKVIQAYVERQLAGLQ